MSADVEHRLEIDACEDVISKSQTELAALKAKIEKAKIELNRGLVCHTLFSITRQQTTYLRDAINTALKALSE